MLPRLSFLLGLICLAIGIFGKTILPDRNESFSFLLGGLTLGGAFIICWIFSIKNYWHGIVGSGIVALLGFCRTMVNLPRWADWLANPAPRPPATPVLEILVAILTLGYIMLIVRSLFAERTRKMLADEQD
jgi:hypothetical protein